MFHKIEKSLLLTIIGVIFLFGLAILVVVVAPNYADETWIAPSCNYQVQMYEVADPNIYINAAAPHTEVLQYVRHLKEGFTLLSFEESDNLHIIAPKKLQNYITHSNNEPLKLTSRLLFLKESKEDNVEAEAMQRKLQDEWVALHPKWKDEGLQKPYFEILELYAPGLMEGFAITDTDGIVEPWVDQNFEVLDRNGSVSYQSNPGVIYIKNPKEYRTSLLKSGLEQFWQYDPNGKPIKDVSMLKSKELGFMSRAELIELGENIFKIEGCWYCHTDQSRTLVEDCVLNGSDSYPAPPSCANEYIYQNVTFPGTKRNGPDISRVGVKRPSRDWHKSHFWSPKTKSKGSIMPAFRHFFDADPHGASKSPYGVPNYKFEGIFQYLMTKGTRITAPTEAWWLGLDPMCTLEIIEGRKK